MATVSLPPGTSDIFPDEAANWQRIEQIAHEVFSLYGYGELRTPIMEFTELFQRGIGGETDVVKKEMYTFKDKGGRSLTLRPEGTAGVMRALTATDVMNGSEQRVYYMGPMFRGEKPAAGRKRQFHQIGIENAGTVTAAGDAESIAILMHLLEALSINDATLLINTRGSFEDRKPAEELLFNHFTENIEKLCHDCKDRIKRNVWRVVDCKNPICVEIVDQLPDITKSFSKESQEYFKTVCCYLDKMGIKYTIDPKLVRGLDYYAHTVFEVIHTGLGAQNSIAGGGRYEVPLPGVKRPIIGVGFAAGVERLIMVQEALNVIPATKQKPELFFVSLGKDAKLANLELAMKLRRKGVSSIAELEDKSMKAQMRASNRSGAKFAIIRGEKELEDGILIYKNLETGDQEEFSEETLLNRVLS